MARVLIVTRGRPDKQLTLEALHGNATLVVSSKSDAPPGADFVVCRAPDIRGKRAWIINNFGGEPFIMADDDLRFYQRTTGMYTRIDDARPVVAAMAAAMKKHHMVGVIPKFMSHMAPMGLKVPAKINHIVGFNVGGWQPKYRLRIGEDHDVTMQAIARGLSVAAITDYAQDDKENARGGCSTWRTPAMELEEAEKLRALWPNYVTLKGHRPTIQLMKLWKDTRHV